MIVRAPGGGMARELDPGLAGRQDRPVAGVDNGFAAGYRVRFDEAGPDGLMRTSSLLRYAQDVAWRHSEDLGFDRGWYAERGLWWVVRGVELEVVAPVAMGTTVRTATAVIGHRRIWARRLAECRLPGGRLAASVRTDWVLVDERGRIVRIPGDFERSFPNPELGTDILRVRTPGGERPPVARVDTGVRPRDVDPMGHANNAVYLDWLEDALSSGGISVAIVPRRVRLEYLASAGPGDAIAVAVSGTERSWTAEVTRASGGDALARAEGWT